ncbi:hypothetical protein Leryth_018528, partial [Lithospermum erythrorhizon]
MQECHDFNTDVHHNEYSSSEPITEADENTSVDRKSSNVGTADDSSQPFTVADENSFKNMKSSDVGISDDHPDNNDQIQEGYDINTEISNELSEVVAYDDHDQKQVEAENSESMTENRENSKTVADENILIILSL